MGWVVKATPRPLSSRERPRTHRMEDWVNPRAGVDVCWKSSPTSIQSPGHPFVASHYTDYAISVYFNSKYQYVCKVHSIQHKLLCIHLEKEYEYHKIESETDVWLSAAIKLLLPYYYCHYFSFSMAQQPLLDQGPLIIGASRS